MSILIKDIKIPQSCTMCWLSPICPVWVKEVSRYKGYEDRLPDCPLIEVPTSHERLVDIDDVYRVLTEYYHHATETQHTALREALSRVPIIVEGEDK